MKHDQPAPEAQVPAGYTVSAEFYDILQGESDRRVAERRFAVAAAAATVGVVDVGAGTGIVTEALLARSAAPIHAVEPSALTNRSNARNAPAAHSTAGSPAGLPFGGGPHIFRPHQAWFAGSRLCGGLGGGERPEESHHECHRQGEACRTARQGQGQGSCRARDR